METQVGRFHRFLLRECLSPSKGVSGSPSLTVDRKLAAKNSKVMRPTLNNYTVTREELEYYASEWFKVLQSGQAKIKYHNIYPLKDAQQCHIVSSKSHNRFSY